MNQTNREQTYLVQNAPVREKTAQKLSEQKAQEQLRETIDGYMAQIDAQNKGMRDWEIETVRSSGYTVNGRSIKRTAIIDSTLMNNVKKTQTVEMYEDFKTVRPETDISSSAGQNAQNAMEKIILAMDGVKQWAVKIFGRKDYNKNGEAVTRERLVNRNKVNESAEKLLLNYEERAKAYDAENKELTVAGYDEKTDGGKYAKLSDGALNEWIGYAPVMTDKPDYKKDKKANVKYEGYGLAELA